ncbi:hypothetical protein [Pseudomonas protegens]|uniref:hypothetical protein n=1 Tax=Pseudomonas protegens TaxID=380021 RepID=UPI0002DCB241
MEVTVHTQLEEQILYPAFKAAGFKEQAQSYYEAKGEHRTVDSLVLSDLKKQIRPHQSLPASEYSERAIRTS